MKIWILSRKESFSSYMNQRFKEVGNEEGINVQIVAPEDFDIIAKRDGSESIFYHGKSIILPECLIPRMGSGTNYFALAVIRHLENEGVFVLNSSSSIELSKDKLASLQKLVTNNLPIPKTMLAKFPLDLDLVKKEFSFPIIIKTVSGSFGKGVFLSETKNKLIDVMQLVEAAKDPKVNVIFQEFVSSSKGRDIRVIVIGGRAIGAMLRKAKRGNYKANFSAGGTVEIFKLTHAIEWLAVESSKLMGLDISGVDLLFDKDHYVVCEVNSAPGFEGFEKATSINVPKEIFEYIKVRLGQKSKN